MYILIAILLLIVILFGVSSTAQSYATAQQAKAQIETAQIGQINAWGNLATILTISLLIVVVVALLAAALWLVYRRSVVRGQRSQKGMSPTVESQPRPQLSMNDLIQLEMLKTLRALNGSGAAAPPARLGSPALPEPEDEDLPFWLR